MQTLVVVLGLGASLSLLTGAEKPAAPSSVPAPPGLPLRIVPFLMAKERQARAVVQRNHLEWTHEVADLFAAATNGACALASDLLGVMHSVSDKTTAPLRPIMIEVDLALDLFCGEDARFMLALGDALVKSIPPGGIYFGGTDPGRGLATALCASHEKADPFFTLTQNALADGSYLGYLREMYGDRIYTPTAADSQRAFDEYLSDARRRLQHDRDFPNEPRQVKPGEDIRLVDGKTQASGQVAVMSINGLLAKVIFDRNKDRAFFIEESFPLDWMYPHLSPHGLIMKLNRRPIETLPADALAKDRQEWIDRLRPLLGGWLDPATSLAEVCDFAERTYLQKDLTGFTGDPKFLDALPARNFCSKLRSSLGGLYAWRATNTKKPEERDRMQKEADFAFRQAFALCPACPEAIFRYVNLLITQGRIEDARQLAETALKVDSANRQLADLLNQLERMGKR